MIYVMNIDMNMNDSWLNSRGCVFVLDDEILLLFYIFEKTESTELL